MPLIFGETASGLLVPVQVDDNGVLAAGAEGWIGSAWQKNPLQFGFSGEIVETVQNTSLSEGTNLLNTTAVPAGEIHVITNIAFRYVGTPPTVVRVGYVSSATNYPLYDKLTPVSDQLYDRQGWWVVDTGSNVRATVTDATAPDDLFLYITGFRIDIDQ